MKKLFIFLLPLATVGCASTLEQINTALASLPGGNQSTTSGGFLLRMTEQQKNQLQATIVAGSKSSNPQQNQAVRDSGTTIYKFIATESCLPGYNASSLNIYAAPGKTFGDFGYNSPVQMMRYNDKSSCATVTRIHGWKMPARNALRFETVYSSDLSGESFKVEHEIVRQPSGEWLFTR